MERDGAMGKAAPQAVQNCDVGPAAGALHCEQLTRRVLPEVEVGRSRGIDEILGCFFVELLEGYELFPELFDRDH